MHMIIANGRFYSNDEFHEEHRKITQEFFLNGSAEHFQSEQWCTIGVEFPLKRRGKRRTQWAVSSTVSSNGQLAEERLLPISQEFVRQMTTENLGNLSNCILFDYMLRQQDAAILRQPFRRNAAARIWIVRRKAFDRICESAFPHVIADGIVKLTLLEGEVGSPASPPLPNRSRS